ncbi:MAG: hypothetical protein GWP39_00690 [Planctomycetia bacterium]|nr:hypothetical protein [Planctomycetia bacterium]
MLLFLDPSRIERVPANIFLQTRFTSSWIKISFALKLPDNCPEHEFDGASLTQASLTQASLTQASLTQAFFSGVHRLQNIRKWTWDRARR